MSREPLVLHGRGIVGGVAEGEALVTKEAISGWGGMNPMQGTIIETSTSSARL
jgi:predicted aconitase with swiveling domain